MNEPHTDGRVRRGNETRRTILSRAVEIASVEGLGGLSIGRLATELELSKSGVFALFGSKEELQLATVRAAKEIYRSVVIEPALQTPPGLGRVWRLCELWLDYSRTRVFPGGCFFFGVSAEFDAQTGRVHDELSEAGLAWTRLVTRCIEEADAAGDLHRGTDPDQLAFEVIALLEAANAVSVLQGGDESYGRASTAILRLLRAAGAVPVPADR